MQGGCLLVLSLPGKALRTFVDIVGLVCVRAFVRACVIFYFIFVVIVSIFVALLKFLVHTIPFRVDFPTHFW